MRGSSPGSPTLVDARPVRGAALAQPGIGRALVTEVARGALRRGLTCLGWGVHGDNVRAKRFYRRLGAIIGNARVASLTGRALTSLGRERPEDLRRSLRATL